MISPHVRRKLADNEKLINYQCPMSIAKPGNTSKTTHTNKVALEAATQESRLPVRSCP